MKICFRNYEFANLVRTVARRIGKNLMQNLGKMSC